MNFAKHRFGLCMIISGITLLCVSLASVLIHVRAANDLYAKKPSVELRASRTSITLPCPPCMHSMSGSCPTEFDPRVRLTATADGFNERVVYSYSVTGGQIVGEGSQVVWDLSSCPPGIYTASAEVQDKKHPASASVTVTIAICGDCVDGDCHCPTIVVNCYEKVKAGTPITCKVVVVSARSKLTFDWSARASNDEDLSERIRPNGGYVSIPTNDLAGRTVYTRVDVKELDPSCSRTASASTTVKP
jgi:hypothetical protein